MRQYTNANKIRVFVWYGQVVALLAGEDVEVLGRAMPHEGLPRCIAGRRSIAGRGL